VNLPGISNRTDADLARSVENTLQWLSYLPTDAVKVMVEHGWVTLSGEVESHYQRLNAANVVRDLIGVKGLTESIGIKPRAARASIKADIEAALRRRLDSNLQDITVTVHDGDVTLSGQVQSLWDRERALGLAWSSAGVRHVNDDLTISFA
jgi:osmotically-inducible protein OsmY